MTPSPNSAGLAANLETRPAADLEARLAAAGVTDAASLQAALDRDPQLRADYEAAMLNALLERFAAVETGDQMQQFWQDLPAELEAWFSEQVEAIIAHYADEGNEELVAHLTPRLESFRQIQQAAQAQRSQPPVVQALMAFVRAPDETAARAIFAERQALLQPYEAQRLLDEQFTSDEPAMQQQIVARAALLRELRGVAPSPTTDPAADELAAAAAAEQQAARRY